jgi:hypothetical protein
LLTLRAFFNDGDDDAIVAFRACFDDGEVDNAR